MKNYDDKVLITKALALSDALMATADKVDEVYTDLVLRGKSIPQQELAKIFAHSKELRAIGVSFDDTYGLASSLVRLETVAMSLIHDSDPNKVGSGIKLLAVALSNATLTYSEPLEQRCTLRDRYPDFSTDSMSGKDKLIALFAAEVESIGFRSGTYDFKYHLRSMDVGFIVEKALGA